MALSPANGPIMASDAERIDHWISRSYGPPPFGRARSSGVEHLTFNQRVDGSIPSGLTKLANEIIDITHTAF